MGVGEYGSRVAGAIHPPAAVAESKGAPAREQGREEAQLIGRCWIAGAIHPPAAVAEGQGRIENNPKSKI